MLEQLSGSSPVESGLFGISGYDLFGWVIFGGAGMLACAWGKMKDLWQPWVLGVALMVYPYFIPAGFLMWGLGISLTTMVFFAKQ